MSRATRCSYLVALCAENPPNPGTPIGLTTVVVKPTNHSQQVSIGHRPGALWACPPGIIPCRRHGQGSAHQADRIATVVLLDHSISHRHSFAKNAAARRKKSRSCFKIVFSRLSRASSSCSARIDWRVWPWLSACCCSVRQRTASALNSSVYCRRVLGGHAALRFHPVPPYTGVFEIGGRSVDAGVPIQVVTWNLSINKLHTDVWQKGIVRSPPGTAARRVRIAD